MTCNGNELSFEHGKKLRDGNKQKSPKVMQLHSVLSTDPPFPRELERDNRSNVDEQSLGALGKHFGQQRLYRFLLNQHSSSALKVLRPLIATPGNQTSPSRCSRYRQQLAATSKAGFVEWPDIVEP